MRTITGEGGRVFAGFNLDAQFYLTWVLSDANGL